MTAQQPGEQRDQLGAVLVGPHPATTSRSSGVSCAASRNHIAGCRR